MSIKETIRRILREETELPVFVRRRFSPEDLDWLVNDVKEMIDDGESLDTAIYDGTREFIKSRKFTDIDEFGPDEDYWISYLKYEKPLVDYVKKKLRITDNVNESILSEETSLKTKIKDMISKNGFFTTSRIFGSVENMNNILGIKGSKEEMIFIVKAIMEHDIEVLVNVCNFRIVPTLHSLKLYVEIPKYYPNHSDDYYPNKQKTFEARDYISDLIKKFGNGLVRGHHIEVQVGDC